VAQDWRDLDAERASSSFDQRHHLSIQFEYATAAGRSGIALLRGWRGALLKGWTATAQVVAGSGLPGTPLYVAAVAGTGVVGLRPDVDAAARDAIPAGHYLNPDAYSLPAPGQWGTAGRNSVRGPAQFSCDASLVRSIALGDRRSLEWRLDATNVLNRVTYASVDTILGGPQFGLPNRANPMRALRTGLRFRF
jgi:hypothetical protein